MSRHDLRHERPVDLNGDHIRAVFDGRKTQIRQLIIPEPVVPRPRPLRHPAKHPGPYFDAYCGERKTEANPRGMSDRWCWWSADDRPDPLTEIRCPFGAPAERLWVREAHAKFMVGEGEHRPVPQCVAYRATCDSDGGFDYANGRGEVMRLKVTKWTPAICMPRWASRISLEVTDVRAQRLQEISEEDARADGVEAFDPTTIGASLAVCLSSRRTWFSAIWDSINGKLAQWSSNPWVWAATFRRLA